MSIRPGETSAGLRTIYFPMYTSDGLLADGGSDPNYEGAAISSPTVQYNHNLDGWTAAGGTFTSGTLGGECSYAFTAGETAIGLTNGQLGVRVTHVGDRTQTMRVTFGDGIQPGETVDDNRRIYFPMFTDAGYVVSGGADTSYEVDATYVADLLAHAVVEYQHDSDGWSAADNALVHESGDEWSYTFSDSETDIALTRGTLAIRVTATGALLDGDGNPVVYRTTVVRANFGARSGGDGVKPTISVISPTPGVAAGDSGGFPRDAKAASSTPIVLELADLAPGLAYFVVIARFYSTEVESPNPVEEVVYRRGNFRGLYVRGSFVVPNDDADGLVLSVLRDGGWPTESADGLGPRIVFAVDALDGAGNLAD